MTHRIALLVSCMSLLILALTTEAPAAMHNHVITLTEPVTEAEDGLLLGNGDLSVSVFQTRDALVFRLGKGDVWDRRVDRRDDPKMAHISEIAHGIAVEHWKCPPYGDAPPVALSGTDDPQRMKELCQAVPPSYSKRPYPCPKPVGEFILDLPQDLPGLSVRQELTLEEGVLRIVCKWTSGVELKLTCYVPPAPNVLVVRWEMTGWTEETKMGHDWPPVMFALRRWADPDILRFAQNYDAFDRHGGFLTFDIPKCSPMAPPTCRDVAGRKVIEQAFEAEPTFPKGFRYIVAPFLSDAAIQPMDLGASREAYLRIVPAQATATAGWAAVAVPTSSDEGGPEAELGRLVTQLTSKPAEKIAKWEEDTRADAARFWSRSGVEIADPLLENLWYETFHARRCTTRFGKTPPGLFLPSTVRDYSHWHGDYHSNYNYQQPYWGDYTANQIELGDAYFTGMEYFLQMGKIIAERYYGTRGVFIQLTGYPIKAEDDVLGLVPMGRMAYMTGWASNQYWWRYLYTHDKDWLRKVGYPVLRDCALFYLDFMKKEDDGLYHIFPSNQGEDGFSGNPDDYKDRAQVMRFCRYCLRSAIQASEVLGIDADLREQWRDRVDHAAGDERRPPYKMEGLVKYFYEANPPEFGDGHPYVKPKLDPNAEPWPPWRDMFWYSGQYPVGAMGVLRSQGVDGDRMYIGLRRVVQRWRHPNGLIWAMSVNNYGHAGAWTETLGMCAPLQEMMLQSYGGVLRLFPDWPAKVAASFRTFRAEGAFLVSAAWADGAVASAEVFSERGGPCRLYSPWEAGLKVAMADGKAVKVDKWQDDILTFDTTAGATYRLLKP
jgi:hypothetical protein